jgi:hypothetical protein
VKQTLIEIQGYLRRARMDAREPEPGEVGAIIDRHLAGAENRDRFMRGLGDFVGQALGGAIIIPERWTPPD